MHEKEYKEKSVRKKIIYARILDRAFGGRKLLTFQQASLLDIM